MKTRYWILIFAGVAAVCVLLTALLFRSGAPAGTAEVYSGGERVAMLDLSADRELTVEYEGGHNTVAVKDGKVAVTAADCPDKYCVKCGAKSSGSPIICLPNKLVIRFSDKAGLDAVTH